MICDLDLPYAASTHNGQGRAVAHTEKTPERTGWELLAWAILEQAVDDLASLCCWGVVTERGKCLPWPREMKKKGGYLTRVNTTIAGMRGPKDHLELKAFFLSERAQEFCDLIGCGLPPAEIYASTVKNHGGLK
jgi:hypothetical protein